MKDIECVQFLQWALPQMRMRWPGFRKVRRQACKRVGRRIRELQLPTESAYRSYLEAHPDEWQILDRMCQITISRFYRDRNVFTELEKSILPLLAESALAAGHTTLDCWCVGGASGEEPYTLALIWEHTLQQRFPGLTIRILATDANPQILERAKRAVYPVSALKDLPPAWQKHYFVEQNEGKTYRLRSDYKEGVEYRCHDIRDGPVKGKYWLVFCRNLTFTYFAEDLQKEILQYLWDAMESTAVLVVGVHETLPTEATGFSTLPQGTVFYQKEIDVSPP